MCKCSADQRIHRAKRRQEAKRAKQEINPNFLAILASWRLGAKAGVFVLIASLVLVAQAGEDKTPAGYLMATAPRQWSFPRDHGRHDGFKTEWWYFTGNVVDSTGRKFGYQLTFFRTALAPASPVERQSPWAARDLYFAHAAVSDLNGKQFLFKDRIERGRAGVAACAEDTLDVALLDWSAKLQPTDATHPETIALDATEPSFAIHLKCGKGVGPVLQGPGGVNTKGHQRGQASYYYSMTRLPTSGTIVTGGHSFTVTGQTWMDHEFSSNALAANQIGWDWVGLTLADGHDLMIYRLRNTAGESDFLSGTLIDSAGHPTYLTDKDIAMAGSSPWTSDSGGKYPQSWSLKVAGLGALTVRSRMPGQELRTYASTKVDYFEGSCEVLGIDGRVAGEGYLEMTGYAKAIGQP